MNSEIIEGDCLNILPSIPDQSINLILTDPPYGIGYTRGNQSSGGNRSKRRSETQVKWKPIVGDDKPNGDWLTECYRVMKDGTALYFTCRWDVEPIWRELCLKAGFIVKQRLTWHKRASGKGDLKGTYGSTTEDVIFATKGRHILNSRPSALIDVGCVPTWEYRHHPHQKPVSLYEVFIRASTKEGDTILDPFLGSGTTGLAAIKNARNFIGIEIDPEYCRISRERIKETSEG